MVGWTERAAWEQFGCYREADEYSEYLTICEGFENFLSSSQDSFFED